MSNEFDPDAILNAAITADDYDGKKALIPEGTYNNCKIVGVRAFEPNERNAEKGVKARLQVTFASDDYDGELVCYVNWKGTMHPKSTWAKLVKAIWAKEVAIKKTPRDLVGEHVNAIVFHEEGDLGVYADWRFTSVKKAKA